jgi:hypothetical protein
MRDKELLKRNDKSENRKPPSLKNGMGIINNQ